MTRTAPIPEFHVPADAVLLDDRQIETILPLHRTTRIRLRHRPRDPLPALLVGGKVLYQLPAVIAWINRQKERHAAPLRPRGRPRKLVAVAAGGRV